MTSTTILGTVGIVALVVLMWLSRIAERITTGDPDDGQPMDDQLAGAGDMIEIGDALFTAEEFGKLVDLSIAYHSAPTTGGDR